MKAQSDSRPEPIQSIGNGKYYVNMDIREDKTPQAGGVGEGENRTSYEYESVKVSGYPVYGEVVEQLVRERYSVSDELAIQRQRETKPEAFAEYNTYVEACKAMAKPVFFPSENGGE